MPTPGSHSARRLLVGVALAVTGAVTLTSGLVPANAAPWDDVSQVCRVKDTRIVENSGMSRSTYPRRAIFVHNDSGGGPQFFAINARKCGTKAVFSVPGAPAKDWEDMASGPGHTLWFGDIGGNRSEINVVRVREPRQLRSRSLRHVAYRLAYPDGAHNAEAMMIRPGNGRLFVITKAASAAGIYRAPKTLERRGVNRLVRVADAPGQTLSGADYARTGKRFVIRGYKTAFVFSSLRRAPRKVQLPEAHTFGESVTFDRAGAMIYGAEGVNEWLWRVR